MGSKGRLVRVACQTLCSVRGRRGAPCRPNWGGLYRDRIIHVSFRMQLSQIRLWLKLVVAKASISLGSPLSHSGGLYISGLAVKCLGQLCKKNIKYPLSDRRNGASVKQVLLSSLSKTCHETYRFITCPRPTESGYEHVRLKKHFW